MSTHSRLPFDVLEYIVNILAEEGKDHNIRDIKAIAETCKMMVPLAHKHLFSSLFLKGDENSQMFSEIISNNPGIIHYIQKLQYRVRQPHSEFDVWILNALKNRSSGNLWSVVLKGGSRRTNWALLPRPLQALLESVLQIPSIKQVTVKSLIKFPSNVLSACRELNSLSLESVIMAPPSGDTQAGLSISRGQYPAPTILHVEFWTHESLDTILSQETLLFHKLKTARFGITKPSDMHTVMILLKMATRLENLEIQGWNSTSRSVMPGLGAAWLADAHRTLSGSTDFLLKTTQEPTKTLSALNELDVLLTIPGAYPNLRRVSVTIAQYLGYGSTTEDLPHDISEKDFPRLAESDAVEFIFSETEYSFD